MANKAVDKIVLATNNQGKVIELKDMLKSLGIEVLSLKDFPHLPEVVEDGDTFEENALKKATEVCRATGLVTLSDDSGLEVDALEGAPGVHSARFAGEEKSDLMNNQKLLKLLKDVPDNKRGARFRCMLAMVIPEGEQKTFDGTCEGYIGREMKGDKGFGYDPLFFMPEYDKTVAELDLDNKNKISHRGKAFQKALAYINEFYGR